jgi:AmmeMemoRadiSam system protein B
MAREAMVAGRFYPGDPEELRCLIGSYIHKHTSLSEAKAVIVPHAGYIYSGSVAGKVFSSVKLPGRIILLGPNHSGKGADLALSPAGTWNMPLGTVDIDSDINQRLLAECPELREDPLAHKNEHSLEVQLPFLQLLQPQFRFSAICIRTIQYTLLEKLGHTLARVTLAAKESVLLISSSDMTHYRTAEDASKQDQYAIDRILALDPRGLYETVLEKNISMCGFAPTVAVLVACRDLGASTGRLICYTNSGEASGDYNHVVGYAGITIK